HENTTMRTRKVREPAGRCEFGENNTWRLKSAVWSRLSAQPDARKFAPPYLYHIAARFEQKCLVLHLVAVDFYAALLDIALRLGARRAQAGLTQHMQNAQRAP